MVCSRTPSNGLGSPLLFREEFEVVIMIDVVTEENAWVGPSSDLN